MPEAAGLPVTAADISDARGRVAKLAHRTPVMTSRLFNAQASVEAFFKCENFQRGGAFKIRGASNLILSLSEEQLANGVVTYSSGNHAQAVAIVAEYAGARATIVMPEDAPRSKMEATRSHGARIVTYDRSTGSREAIGQQIADETGAVIVPPYDHPMTIAGQGTTALELLEQASGLDALIAPVGGGGLIAGCAIAAKSVNPAVRIFAAEPELARDTFLSKQQGRRVEVDAQGTIADGLRSPAPGKLTFPVIQQLVESVILVSEQEIRDAVKFLFSRMKIVAEPSGAVAPAAVLFGKLPPGIGKVGVIISGGNVDLETVAGF